MVSSNDAWMGEAQPYLAPRRTGERDAWSAEAAAHNRRGSQRLLAVEDVDPPGPVRDFLNVGPSEKVVVRRRLILLDGEPVELADSYYPAHIAHGTRLAEHRKIPGGAVTLLAALGFTPEDDPLEDVSADTATPTQCEALGLASGAPVLVLTRFTTSAAGEPMEVSVMTMTRHLQYRQRKQAV
ncbi:GntR family transcriptional regulator [Streptomyces sp. IB201691-2A2]|uniref:GntR family transcriptional regulator n=1 Tax=Streptomyces sp. IB201691-2A2 TaxID=2561920 RepID=UPI00118162C3|nr:UTRA domain-containing protein [Streptomyces sp. IB201691-2A2]TRO56212.1 UTRA domain-containing protein [Streptomyces sp. IB201691-2A2]